MNNTNQFFYSQFSGRDNLFVEIGGDGFPGIDFGWDWGNGTKNLTWKFIPNSNYFIKSRLSKTIYNFNVDFAIDFNAGEEDTTETINLDDGGTTDLSLYLDNLVEDIDLNQEVKYLVNDNLNIDLGWQIKHLSLKYTETFAGQQVTNIRSLPKTTSVFTLWGSWEISITGGAEVNGPVFVRIRHLALIFRILAVRLDGRH